MKTAIFTILLALLTEYSPAQFIQQISVIPPNPTSNDPVSVVVEAGFSSGTCEEHTQLGGFVNPNRYEASTLHCVGMLSYICYDADTFNLGLIPAGNYMFLVTVDAGGYPAPCTPGIVPGPMDSLSFTVTSATGVPEAGTPLFSVSPNPVADLLTVMPVADLAGGELFCYDALGSLHWKQKVTDDRNLSVSDLPAGLYFLQYVEGGVRSGFVPFIKSR